MREHKVVIQECASHLGVGFEECHRLWRETDTRRARGEFVSLAAQFDWIVRELGGMATDDALVKAQETYERFRAESLRPVSGALELLDWLTSRGMRIGLVVNCGPDIPHAWQEFPLARYFHYCAFSCQLGAVKPEPEIYRSALEALNLEPRETLYVGDGSRQELSGAACCGIRPILLSVDLSNTYDPQRTDLEAWKGPMIHALSELPRFLEESEEV